MGLIILLASSAYMVGSVRILIGYRSNVHFGIVTVALIGLTTAIEIVVSLKGILARRQEKEPILEAIKLTSLVSSMIGLVLVQTTILDHLGRETNIYFDLLGIFLGFVSSCIGIYMIVSTKSKVRSE